MSATKSGAIRHKPAFDEMVQQVMRCNVDIFDLLAVLDVMIEERTALTHESLARYVSEYREIQDGTT